MPEKRQKQSPVLKPHRSLLNVHNLQPSGFMESSGPYLFTSDLARQRLEGTRKLRVRRSLPGSGILQSWATVAVVTRRPVGSGKRKTRSQSIG